MEFTGKWFKIKKMCTQFNRKLSILAKLPVKYLWNLTLREIMHYNQRASKWFVTTKHKLGFTDLQKTATNQAALSINRKILWSKEMNQ